MAGRIQGITVEIGGDTTKLQTALKGVNTEIRNTQSQLKDVDKLLKLDPGNTELLAQKHRLLGDAVKETKEKLETLKTAAEQADEALKNGTITQEQYNGLQREIAETEAKLKSLEEQANQSATAFRSIAAKGEKLKTVGERVRQLRTDRHLTLSALSEELNCSRDHLSKVENNKRCPSLDMLAELSAYFGVSMVFGEYCDSFQLRADLLKVISELTEVVRKI